MSCLKVGVDDLLTIAHRGHFVRAPVDIQIRDGNRQTHILECHLGPIPDCRKREQCPGDADEGQYVIDLSVYCACFHCVVLFGDAFCTEAMAMELKTIIIHDLRECA